MRAWVEREARRAWAAWQSLTPAQRMAAVVLVAATVFVLVQLQVGSRRFFRLHLAEVVEPENQALAGWAWWFGMQGVTGFVLPVLLLRLAFRQSVREMGLGLGDWKLAGALALAYLPLVAIGTWFLSGQADFQLQYPRLRESALDLRVFALYHTLYLFYWLGWEYLWRGFVLFGTVRAVGPVLAIVLQTVPFAILHASKPPAEAYLSILGGLALGALVWRCRSFWIAVPIHAAQMLLLEAWIVLRMRADVLEGTGLGALRAVFG